MPIENLWVIDSRSRGILWRCGLAVACSAGSDFFSPASVFSAWAVFEPSR
jgi:hypothetical protein